MIITGSERAVVVLTHDRGELRTGGGRPFDVGGGGERRHRADVAQRALQERVDLRRIGIRIRERDGARVEPELPLQREREERVLALGVGVQEAGRHAGPARDVGHEGSPVALLREHLERRFHDLVEPFRRPGPSHGVDYH